MNKFPTRPNRTRATPYLSKIFFMCSRQLFAIIMFAIYQLIARTSTQTIRLVFKKYGKFNNVPDLFLEKYSFDAVLRY